MKNKPQIRELSLPSASIRDGANKFNRDFEEFLTDASAISRFLSDVNRFAKGSIDPILENIPKTEWDPEWVYAIQEKANEARQKYWDILQTQSNVDLELVLYEAEIMVERMRAVNEISMAARECCDIEEEDISPTWVARSGAPVLGAAAVDCIWSYDGARVAVAAGRNLYVIDPKSYQVILKRSFDDIVRSVHYSPGGTRLYVGTREGGMVTLRSEDLGVISSPVSLPGPFKSMTVSPRGDEAVLLSTAPAHLRRVSLPGNHTLDTGEDLVPGWSGDVGVAAAYSHNQRYLALSGSESDRLVVLDRATKEPVQGVPQPDGFVQQVAFSRDDEYLLVAQRFPLGTVASQPSLLVVEIETMSRLTLASVPSAPCMGVSSSANGQYICASFLDSEEPVAVYRTDNWERETVTTLPGRMAGTPSPASSAKFSPSENLISATFMGSSGGMEVLFRQSGDIQPPDLIAVRHVDGGLEVEWSPVEGAKEPDGFNLYIRSFPYSGSCPPTLPDPVKISTEDAYEAGGPSILSFVPDLSADVDYYVSVSSYLMPSGRKHPEEEAFSRVLMSQSGEEFDDRNIHWAIVTEGEYQNLPFKDPNTIYFVV